MHLNNESITLIFFFCVSSTRRTSPRPEEETVEQEELEKGER